MAQEGGVLILAVVSILLVASVTPVSAPVPPSPPNGTPPTIYITADPSEIPADGCSTSTITVSVWDGEYWIFSGLVVNFSTDIGEITKSAQIENGTATAVFTAGTTEGVATITAEVNLGEDILCNTTTVSLTATEFDTGAGGYPSIAGVHDGFIIPNETIEVRKIYIYPCAGTGGHAEFVEIRNESFRINASWEGYKGDYHNLTFSYPFKLMADEVYRYKIVTGSYPEIIHNQSYITLDGSFINCTSFVDVNGRIYDDWIPAFRLVQ